MARNLPDGVGSSDLTRVMAWLNTRLVAIPQSKRRSKVANENVAMAGKWFHTVLFVRVLVLHEFLLCAKQQPGGITDSMKCSWLLLQLSPKSFFGKDIFWDRAHKIHSLLSSDQLEELLSAEIQSVEEILGKTLIIALDEAQTLTDLFTECFWSVSTPGSPRPVIRPLVDKWSSLIENIIISGTGLSMRSLGEALSLVVAKDGTSETVTEVGAFESLDSESSQQRYLERYLPKHLLTNESG